MRSRSPWPSPNSTVFSFIPTTKIIGKFSHRCAPWAIIFSNIVFGRTCPRGERSWRGESCWPIPSPFIQRLFLIKLSLLRSPCFLSVRQAQRSHFFVYGTPSGGPCLFLLRP